MQRHTENTPFFLAFIIAIVFFGLAWKYKKQLRDFGSLFAPINVFLVALTLPYYREVTTHYENIWFYAHVILSMVYAFIIAGSVVALVYILTQRDLKRKKLDSFLVSKFSSSLVFFRT
ncbi:MAG: hypothetical protein Q9M89_03375 [Persephonella sp.]|nr:hypothetical protein [Persephonella sp.]